MTVGLGTTLGSSISSGLRGGGGRTVAVPRHPKHERAQMQLLAAAGAAARAAEQEARWGTGPHVRWLQARPGAPR